MSAPCKKIEADLWRYVDRELSARELRAVSRHLKTCAACRRLFEERAREAKVWRMAFEGSPFGEGFTRRFRKRFASEGLAVRDGLDREAVAYRPLTMGRGERLRRYVVAALFIFVPSIVLIGFMLTRQVPRGLGTCSVEGPDVTLRSAGGAAARLVSRGRGSRYRAGDGFEVPAGSTLTLTVDRVAALSPDEQTATLRVEGPAFFEVTPDATAVEFDGLLSSGILRATVLRRSDGETFAIRTPYADAVVVGTKFRVEVDEEARQTKLDVEEGKVSFRQANNGPELLVRENESAVLPVDSATSGVASRDEPARAASSGPGPGPEPGTGTEPPEPGTVEDTAPAPPPRISVEPDQVIHGDVELDKPFTPESTKRH